jgi:sulfotransferase famil protein
VIVSHKNRFIFLRTFKTAGTSIEIALSAHCGPEDILTRLLEPGDEELRKSVGYRGPQNHLVQRDDRPGTREFAPHMTAKAAQGLFPDAWNRYFKFAVVRNPWEVCASAYAMRAAQGTHRGRGFSEFVGSPGFAAWAERWRNTFTIDGRVAVDEIVRYEDLADSLEQVRRRIGLPEPLALPRAKSGYRKGHYREMVNPRDAEIIAKLFATEIKMFGYRY